MVEPIDAVRVIHNAFRQDMTRIDREAYEAARGNKDVSVAVDRFRFFNEVLVWHARGEEVAVFPALESVAPMVAEPYERDHRGLDAAFEALDGALSAKDTLTAARAAAAFKFHLDIHLQKEDLHLYRILKERIPPQDQGKIAGLMANEVPKERFPELAAWLMPLISMDDRETMTRIWQIVMPPPLFSQMKLLIEKVIGKDWEELAKRIPGLN
jgi:hemerythrin-like domain-containing protein